MAQRGMTVHVVPAGSTYEQIAELDPDGLFFSNGPGDLATADHAVGVARSALGAGCRPRDLLRQPDPGPGLGFGTYKLAYGHRGINQPVQDRTTGKVEVTAHNHGFAVKAPLDQTVDTDFGRVQGQATSVSTMRWSKACSASTSLPSASSTTPRRRPDRTTRPICSTDSPPRWRGSADAQAHRHHQRPGHRIRSHRDGQGLRVRLLRYTGLPCPQGRGPAGDPGQQQPGDHHDGPRVRRRHVHRADHPGVRRESDRQGTA